MLALLPTATENILKALPVEELTNELQQKRAQRLARLGTGETTGSEMSSGGTPSVTDDDGRSLSSFVHTSQMGDSAVLEEGQKAKSRTQLWNELKINCEWVGTPLIWIEANSCSFDTVVYSHLHALPPGPPYAHPTQPPRSA